MILSSTLQVAYNKFYVAMREYVWPFDIIQELADLEISIYQRFPDLDSVRSNFKHLKDSIMRSDVYKDDENLQRAINSLEDSIDESDEVYYDISVYKEVVSK